MAKGKANDQFANIAKNLGHSNNLKDGLVRIFPKEIKPENLPMGNFEDEIELPKKMTTQEQLDAELKSMRKKFSPFLQKQAPEIINTRNKIELSEFDWRIETQADQQNFSRVLAGGGEWDTVTIPHFGKPLGNKTTYYRKRFDLQSQNVPGDKESMFIHFNGVDYIAHVYINGYLVGSHEGFFAPFEFEIDKYVHQGENTLVVQVENDFIHKRNELEAGGEMYGGDKIYAATGPGFDDPSLGWHHCPPGMGIYQSAYLEVRPQKFIRDIYARPILKENKVEINTNLFSCLLGEQTAKFKISIFGDNFKEEVVKDKEVQWSTKTAIGLGDTFTEAMLSATGEKDKENALKAEKGDNFFKFTFVIPNPKIWSPEHPYLYQVQVSFLGENNEIIDQQMQTFGMRSFKMDENSTPKGKFYLNEQEIHLRGANTMGFEQHDVMKGDFEQLIDDILLAKIAHMNFWRVTQRPVQEEVYDYCDHLGLMTQSDLPLFGVLRKNKFSEAVKQAGEMEQLVRKHPCNIVDTFINEPFPNANNLPQRHLVRAELERFFKAATETILVLNPDRVIKPVDGDYDPPTFGLPDNHCYTAWYNSHGETMGELAAGFWTPIKKGWNYACGEYGCEGLDPIETMYKEYPKQWLPESPDDDWSPINISLEQSSNFHYQYFDTPRTLRGWVKASQNYQAFATKWMTESFRRQENMISTVLHIFIDHFPAGWMKAVVDVDRNAKPAFFAYRDALTPTMISFKPSRLSFNEGETASVETWVCNDLSESFTDYSLYYEVMHEGNIIGKGIKDINIHACASDYVGDISFNTNGLDGAVTVRCALLDESKNVVHYNETVLKVAKVNENLNGTNIFTDEEKDSKELLQPFTNFTRTNEIPNANTIIINNFAAFTAKQAELLDRVKAGAKMVFYNLKPGDYTILKESVTIKPCGMLPVNFVSRATNHKLIDGFDADDFRFWFDEAKKIITPILDNTFISENKDFDEILTSANMNSKGEWRPELACGEKKYGQGFIIICNLDLNNRLNTNPAALKFAKRLIEV